MRLGLHNYFPMHSLNWSTHFGSRQSLVTCNLNDFHYSSSYRWPSINRSVTFQNSLRRWARLIRLTNNSKPRTIPLINKPTLNIIMSPPICRQVILLNSITFESSWLSGELLSRSHFTKRPISIEYRRSWFKLSKISKRGRVNIDIAMLRIFWLLSKQKISSFEITGLFSACFRDTATATYLFHAKVAKQSLMFSQIWTESAISVEYCRMKGI